MKLLTKNVNIEGKEFYLVSDVHNGQKYYATIPYENTKDGVLIKQMNGAEMCSSFESISDALRMRKHNLVMKRILDRLQEAGITGMEAILKMVDDPEYKALYN